jgi:hypothetical protein
MVNRREAFGFAGVSASADQGILDDVSESPRRIDRWARTTFSALPSRVRGDFFALSLRTRLEEFGEQRGSGRRRC